VPTSGAATTGPSGARGVARRGTYCSTECQWAHWKKGGHKAFCKAIDGLHRSSDRASSGNSTRQFWATRILHRLPRNRPPPHQSSRGARIVVTPGWRTSHAASRLQSRVAEHAVAQSSKEDELLPGRFAQRANSHSRVGTMLYGLASERWSQAQRLPEANDERAEAAQTLGDILVRKYAEAETVLREVVAAATRVWGEDDQYAIDATLALTTALSRQNKYADAETILRHCHAQTARLWGPDDEATMPVAFGQATRLKSQFKNDEALKIYRTYHALLKSAGGSDDVRTLVCASSMTDTLATLQKFVEAQAVISECVPIMKRVLGPEHPVTQMAAIAHANCVALSGRHVDA
jgi:hypothetical protein